MVIKWEEPAENVWDVDSLHAGVLVSLQQGWTPQSMAFAELTSASLVLVEG